MCCTSEVFQLTLLSMANLCDRLQACLSFPNDLPLPLLSASPLLCWRPTTYIPTLQSFVLFEPDIPFSLFKIEDYTKHGTLHVSFLFAHAYIRGPASR